MSRFYSYRRLAVQITRLTRLARPDRNIDCDVFVTRLLRLAIQRRNCAPLAVVGRFFSLAEELQ